MDLLPTVTLFWTSKGQLTLAQPAGGVVDPSIYSDPIATEGADQIGLLVYTTPSGGGTDANVYIRIAWAGIDASTGEPTTFVEECVEIAGAQGQDTQSGTPAGMSFQRFSLYVKEWGPFTTSPSSRGTIWTPAAAPFFKVGCYASVTPTNTAAVTVIVQRATTGAPLANARIF